MKALTTFLILFYLQLVFSQGEANNWYFGTNAGLSFNNISPIDLTDGVLNSEDGCTTISNSAGELLFYTDGVTVFNKLHQVMPNGIDLKGSKESQGVLIVPNPANPNIYYIFTTPKAFIADGVRYSEVNMSLNGGLGAITQNKNIILINGIVSEKLTAIKHANCIDYWMLCHGDLNDSYHAFKITSQGVNSTPVTTNIGAIYEFNGRYGQLKFSPDGKKVGNALNRNPVSVGINNTGFELFDFDAETGILSNYKLINTPNTIAFNYGFEFSLTGDLIYLSGRGGYGNEPTSSKLLQYDLNATNILASEKILYESDLGGFGALQMGPDRKIYFTFKNLQNNFISRIEKPEISGTGCSFVLNAIDLSPGYCQFGLPAFVQSVFLDGIQTENVCLGEAAFFSVDSYCPIVSIDWDFGDGTTSTALNPSHTYLNAGAYTVTAIYSNGVETLTRTKQIVILDAPTANQPTESLTSCETNNDGFYTFDLTQNTPVILNGQSPSQYGVRYYASTEDFDNNIAISNPESYQNAIAFQNQTIFAQVYTLVETTLPCFAVTSFEIEVSLLPVPEIELQETAFVCKDNLTYTTINAGLIDSTTQNNFTYQWFLNGNEMPNETNYNISVNTEGEYSVQVSNANNCTKTRTITVIASDIAMITDIQINDLSENNSIIVLVTGEGTYEYSLDNSTYQSSNVFTNLQAGIYTVYVNDVNGCGISTKEISILGVPKFFTPNGDGFNDTWNIQGINNQSNGISTISIFDRYGKLLTQIKPLELGWDGLFNGQQLPSTDYWYTVTLENGKILKGHFALKR